MSVAASGAATPATPYTVVVAFNNTLPAQEAVLHAAELCLRLNANYRLLIVYVVALNPRQTLPGIDRLERAFNVEIEASSEEDIQQCRMFLRNKLFKKVSYEFYAVEGEGETGPVFDKYIRDKHPDTNLFVIGTTNKGHGLRR
ncbi:hypothetical protein BC831DRAFT_467088 [Entophlyctis helioformis]|nr:hypothetical protein BC831DRAFT_467088 [Entophlyctis helioformis]